MRKRLPTGRENSEAVDDGTLFPATWPWRAWYAFEQALLATVYAKSGDLWPILRDRCRDITTWLEHLDYEGEIEPNSSFNAAAKFIRSWSNAEASLRQARNLLGKQIWESLVDKAPRK